MRERSKALLACGLVVVAASAGLGRPDSALAAPPARGLVISADELQVDASTRVATAIGRVRISDGATTATATRGVLYHREGRGVLRGAARVRGPQGILEGREITFTYTPAAITRVVARGDPSLETTTSLVSARVITLMPAGRIATAEDDLRVFVPPDVVATGRRLVYDQGRGMLTLDGRPRVQNPDGFVEGNHLEGTQQWDRIVMTGDVRAAYRDVEARSQRAEVFVREKRAVLIGDVRVTQPGRQMTTERATLWYATGRVVAEGQTWMRLEPRTPDQPNVREGGG